MADYLLQPAPQEEAEEKEESSPDNDKEKGGAGKEARSTRSNLVIFAVDISGSMSTTVEVPALQAEWSSVTGRGGGGGARYISRLEAIKEAVCRHLDHMSVTEPRNKVNIHNWLASCRSLRWPLNLYYYTLYVATSIGC